MLEAGRRFRDEDFPKNSWHLKDFLFAPKLGCYGIQRFHALPDVTIMAGAGVGGGSLVYANTLYVPPKMFFDDPQWAGITDWATELAPYYDQAMRMLGVVMYVGQNPSDVVMKAVADEMGVGHTYTNTPVGVFFGNGPGLESPDPYFGGRGPARNGCLECGECCTGCRHNAKNTLPKNYLGLAEAAGATVHPMTTVTAIRPGAEGGYAVAAERTGPAWSRRRRTFTAEHVIVAAGTYNTQRLLHRMRDAGHLPNLSRRLGELTRTNSESVLGALTKHRDVDYTQGVAVTSSFHPDPDTHIQAPRYGKGSNLLGLLGTVLTDEESGVPRWRTWAGVVLSNPGDVIDGLKVRHWSERCMVIAAMQPLDNSLTVSSGKGRTGRWRLIASKVRASQTPTPSRSRTGWQNGSRRRSTAPRTATSARCSVLRSQSISSVARSSAPTPTQVSSTRTTGSTAIRDCMSWTGPRSLPTSGPTLLSPSRPRPSARWRCGPTRASGTPGPN